MCVYRRSGIFLAKQEDWIVNIYVYFVLYLGTYMYIYISFSVITCIVIYKMCK